jgi:hypothetical protein
MSCTTTTGCRRRGG